MCSGIKGSKWELKSLICYIHKLQVQQKVFKLSVDPSIFYSLLIENKNIQKFLSGREREGQDGPFFIMQPKTHREKTTTKITRI